MALDINPIIVKEVRARWRGRAFLLLLIYVLVLALTVLFTYHTSSYRISKAKWEEYAPIFGHELFSAFTVMQVIGWMLIGPALTATSISSERELGMLESLQMSPLHPLRIAWGKLAGVLLFVALMLLASLPITSTCFQMGGVSGAEFCDAVALQFVTAAFCAAVGIFFSAVMRRSQSAVIITFGCLIIWFFTTLFAFGYSLTPGSAFSSYPKPLDWLLSRVCLLYGQTNPLLAILVLIEPTMNAGFGKGPFWISYFDPLVVSLVDQALGIPILLWLASRVVRKPLTEDYQIAAKPRTAGDPQEADRPTQRSEDLPPSHWEFPVVRWLCFRNPMLQRECRAKFRMRRLKSTLGALLVFLSIMPMYWYLRELYVALLLRQYRDDIFSFVVIVGLIAALLAVAVIGANAFAGEHEGKTWEAIELSLLTPHEIVTAKLFPPLLACLLYSLPLWPLLAVCIDIEPLNSYPQFIVPECALASVAVIAAAVWCCGAFATFLSWFFRRTSVAIGWVLGSSFAILVFLPMIFILVMSSQPGSGVEDVLRITHPFMALSTTLSQGDYHQHWASVWANVALLFGAGCLWRALLVGQLEQRRGLY